MLEEDCKGVSTLQDYTRQGGQVYRGIARKRRKGSRDSVGHGQECADMWRAQVGEWTAED